MRRPTFNAAALAATNSRRRPDWPTSTNGNAASGAVAPILRRRRSVGHVGRYIKTTLRIARTHNVVRAFAGATTDQLEQPSGAADTRDR